MKPAEGSTVIGKSVLIRGEISAKEDLYLDCDLEGAITLSDSCLTLGPDARIVANVTVRDLVIFGSLSGNIQASGRVELRQSASVTGDIIAARLSIEESAILKGRVELKTGAAKPVSTPQQTSAPAVISPEPLILQSKP